MKKQIIIALATLTALPAVSQEKWDLRKCIDYAIEHNLSIKQQEAARDHIRCSTCSSRLFSWDSVCWAHYSHSTHGVPTAMHLLRLPSVCFMPVY